jgi:tripartite-type tricarboxylate transporter receptor subunit TctC
MNICKFVFFILTLTLTASSLAATTPDPARNYPDRPIRLIMPNAPGSSTDTMGRIVAVKLGEVLGQQLVVDNRAGAGGSIGMEIGKNATPDGYTLIVTSLGALTVSPHIRKLAYDPIRDFEYVAMYSRQGNVLVVHPGLPVKNVRELIDYAKTRGGKLVMASAGNGAQSHLNGSALMAAAGFSSLHVPYKGGGPSVAAVVAGEAQWTIVPSAATMSLIRAGRLRALGHSLPGRSTLFPDIPPIGESVAGFKYVAFSGLLAPKGVPGPVLGKLRSAMAGVVGSPDVREQFASQGAEPATGTSEEFRKAVHDELLETGKLVKLIGLTADR